MSQSSKRAPSARGVFAIALLLCACGTVAGNPKKPDVGKETPTTPPGSSLYTLPSLNFDLDDATVAGGAAFSMHGPTFRLDAGAHSDADVGAQSGADVGAQSGADSEADSSFYEQELALADVSSDGFVAGLEGRSFFNGYGRRLNAVTRTLDATSARLNALARAQGKVVEGEPAVVRVVDRGNGGTLSARFGPSSDARFDREVVVCNAGKPLQLFRWKTDGSSLETWRDLSRGEIGGANGASKVVSRVRAQKEAHGEARLDIATFGRWSDGDGDATGQGIIERLFATRDSEGEIHMRAVTDRFEGAPPSVFGADAYFVGRLLPIARGAQGRSRRYEPTFVGFSASSKRRSCAAGFDEKATDLWLPSSPVGSPRFCLARALGGKALRGFESFRGHVKSFEPIGLLTRSDLEKIALPKDLTCESR